MRLVPCSNRLFLFVLCGFSAVCSVLVPTPGEHLSIPVTTIARDVPYSVVFSPNSRPITGIRPAMLSCQRVTNRNQLQPHALCQLRHRTSDKLPRRPRVFGDPPSSPDRAW